MPSHTLLSGLQLSHNEMTQNPVLRRQAKAIKYSAAPMRSAQIAQILVLRTLARLPGVSVLCREGLCPDLHGQIPSLLCAELSKEQNHQAHPW